MKRIALFASVLLLSTTGYAAENEAPVSTAATPSAPAPEKAAEKKAGKDKVICERVEVLGTRLGGRRVCKTAAQWAEEREQARDDVNKIQTNRGCVGEKNC